MRLDELDTRRGRIKLVLSERNVRALLAKITGHPSDSECTLTKLEADPVFGYIHVMISVEDDEVHYGVRPYPPGEIHPETEAAMNQ